MPHQQVAGWGGPCKGTQSIDGGAWQPYQPANVVTPPFPEFTSGHSTFSAAGAAVLTSFTGSATFGGSVSFSAGSSAVEGTCFPPVPPSTVTPDRAAFSYAGLAA